MKSITQDLKYTLVRLSEVQGFVFIIVMTLGLTLGAMLCIFSLNWLLLVKPLPYPDQHRLVYIQGQSLKNNEMIRDDVHIYPIMTSIYNNAKEFDSTALISYNDNIIKNLPDTPRLDMTYVSPEYFTLLNMPMELGQSFDRSEGVGNNKPVAVISYSTWQDVFNAKENILDEKIKIGNVHFAIIGVAAKHFEEPELNGNSWQTKVWLPWEYNEIKRYFKQTNNWTRIAGHIKLIARLKSPDTKENYLSSLSQRLTNWTNDIYKKNNSDASFRKFSIAMQVKKLEKKILGDSYITALLMFAGVISLLCIAGANITNLFFARSAQTQRSFAIRSALGAKPWHLYRAMFFETSVIMTIAVLFAALVALPGKKLLIMLSTDHFPRVNTLSFGFIDVAFLLVCGLILALFFSWVVYRQIDYRQLITSFQGSGKGSGLQVSKKTRQGLIVSQVLVASLLLTSTLTLFNESLRLWLTPPSVTLESRYLLRLGIRQETEDNTIYKELTKKVIANLANYPEIERITHSNAWPYSRHSVILSNVRGTNDAFSLAGNSVDEKWLSFYGIELKQGRNVNHSEINDGVRVLLVNETAAKLLSKDGDIMKQQFHLNKKKKLARIVGVVENIALPGQEPEARVYYPRSLNDINLAFKVVPGYVLTREHLSKLLFSIDKRLYVSRLLDCKERFDKYMARDQLIVFFSLAVSLLALFLVGIGLYGILSYQVQLTRFDLGVRMAIGAKPIHILLHIVTQALKPAGFGLIVSFMLGMTLYWFYYAEINNIIHNANIAWLLPAMSSVLFILSIIVVTCYLPIRELVTNYPVGALKGKIE